MNSNQYKSGSRLHSHHNWLFGCLHGYMNTVSYLMHVGGCLRGCVLSMLFEAALWLSASYMRHGGGCLQECVRTLSEN